MFVPAAFVDEKFPFASKLPFVNTSQLDSGVATFVEVSTLNVPPAPLLFVPLSTTWPLASVTLKIISLLERNFSVARVQVDAPHAHLIVQPDGSTRFIINAHGRTVPAGPASDGD